MHRPAESSDVPLTSNELQCEHINSIYNLLILGDYKFLLIKVEFLCIKVSQVVLWSIESSDYSLISSLKDFMRSWPCALPWLALGF